MRELSIAGAIALFADMAVEIAHHHEKGLERAARIVEREAKAEIGHYQGEAGPFAAWAELAESTKSQRVALGFAENEPGLRTGEMRDGIGHTVHMTGLTTGEAQVGSNDDKLVWFELGTQHQPPRSVLGGALVRKTHAVLEALGGHVVAGLTGEGVHGGEIRLIDQ